jgi:hypothetical protein
MERTAGPHGPMACIEKAMAITSSFRLVGKVKPLIDPEKRGDPFLVHTCVPVCCGGVQSGWEGCLCNAWRGADTYCTLDMYDMNMMKVARPCLVIMNLT